MRRPLLPALACALGALSLAACRKDEIVTYRVIQDPVPAARPAPAAATQAGTMPGTAGPLSPQATMANTAVTTADGPGLAWTAPAGWTAGPERPMRKATLLIPGEGGGPGAELAITAFPGAVGGDLENINRWRAQLALPPVTEADLAGLKQHLDVGALHIDLVELTGTAAGAKQTMITAIVPHDGAKWFFKLTGPETVVAREKPAFVAFVRTIRPQG